ncbi:hypothetical protein [Breoghania sp. L-A4]|uniref:hypothetical protein n=1 Tax=Breoghania sp. L-A4 TaxID=2304600 RepID=UPI000E35FA3F|nr:hypothetical protein [Breoghania sp. L-A4]AXS41478.1 hypothetical protein D1F64_17520 [Breoghania sp. L-A4]
MVGIKANQKFSFVENNAKWREKRQAANEQYRANQANLTNIFTVNSNAAATAIELTYQRVTERFQAELSAKADEREKKLDTLSSSLDISV